MLKTKNYFVKTNLLQLFKLENFDLIGKKIKHWETIKFHLGFSRKWMSVPVTLLDPSLLEIRISN